MGQLAQQEKGMTPFDKCPVCGGKLVDEVEKLLKGGVHTAVLKAHAAERLQCGTHLYSNETIRRFEQIRQKRESQEVAGFHSPGQSSHVTEVD